MRESRPAGDEISDRLGRPESLLSTDSSRHRPRAPRPRGRVASFHCADSSRLNQARVSTRLETTRGIVSPFSGWNCQRIARHGLFAGAPHWLAQQTKSIAQAVDPRTAGVSCLSPIVGLETAKARGGLLQSLQ